MSNNDEESWYYSKFCSLTGKKEDKTWNQTFANMIKEEDESWMYSLTKKGAKMGYKMIYAPLTIATDIVEIAVSAYKHEKKQVAIGLFTLATDIYSYGSAGAITKEITKKAVDEVYEKVGDQTVLLFTSQIFTR